MQNHIEEGNKRKGSSENLTENDGTYITVTNEPPTQMNLEVATNKNSSLDSREKLNEEEKSQQDGVDSGGILINEGNQTNLRAIKSLHDSYMESIPSTDSFNNSSPTSFSVPTNISYKILGNVKLPTTRIDPEKLMILDENNLENLEVLGKGNFGYVQKAYDKKRKTYFAIKYRPPQKNESMDEVLTDIETEHFILDKIKKIDNRILLKYYGLKKDYHNNIVFVMESGAASLADLMRVGIRFSQGELLYILKEVVEQLVLLQQNGVCNRDIKPANILIMNQENGRYCYKIADFGIGCVVNRPQDNLIKTDRLIAITRALAAPEVKAIADENYQKQFYDPFKADVYSLGVCMVQLLDRLKSKQKIKEFLNLMMQEDPEKRIGFLEILEKLKSSRLQEVIITPKIEEYIKEWKRKKNLMKTKFETILEYSQKFELYKRISKEKDASVYIELIEENLPSEFHDKMEKSGEGNEFLSKIYQILGEFFKNEGDREKAERYFNNCSVFDGLNFGGIYSLL